MLKLGNSGLNISGFTDDAELFLGEAAKYLILLLFAVLAIRLWRRSMKLPAENRPGLRAGRPGHGHRLRHWLLFPLP